MEQDLHAKGKAVTLLQENRKRPSWPEGKISSFFPVKKTQPILLHKKFQHSEGRMEVIWGGEGEDLTGNRGWTGGFLFWVAAPRCVHFVKAHWASCRRRVCSVLCYVSVKRFSLLKLRLVHVRTSKQWLLLFFFWTMKSFTVCCKTTRVNWKLSEHSSCRPMSLSHS